jgi:hypothetical protein
MPQDEDFITVAGAARLARVSQGTIRRWLEDPAVKITKYVDGSKRVWVDRKQVLAHITPMPKTSA